MRTVGVEISICLLDMPWMAIWPAAWPRTEGMTPSWYGPTGTGRWLAGLAPGADLVLEGLKGLFPERVELALREPDRVEIDQSHHALVLLLVLGEIGQVDRDAGDRGGEAIGLVDGLGRANGSSSSSSSGGLLNMRLSDSSS